MLWNRSSWPPKSNGKLLDIMDENIISSDDKLGGSVEEVRLSMPCCIFSGARVSLAPAMPGVTVLAIRDDLGERFGL